MVLLMSAEAPLAVFPPPMVLLMSAEKPLAVLSVGSQHERPSPAVVPSVVPVTLT